MTRTKRCYNKKPILGGPGLKSIVRNSKIPDWDHLYRPYGNFCMGRCPTCRDQDKEWRYKRKENRYIEIMLEKLGSARGIGDWLYREDDGTFEAEDSKEL